MKTRSLSFFLCFTAILFFASCKKTDVTQPEQPVLSSKDPQAVSAAVKVWHGERLQGNAPAPRGSGLDLDASASAPITFAFTGRYAIINPAIAQGDVAGYYLQFNGSKEHFKIDYTKPRGNRIVSPKKKTGFVGQDGRMQNGNADSSIVIVLPASLQVPDTICVSYCAYDAQGNISNVVNTCIVVNSLGADAAGSFLNGVWKHTAFWDTSAHDTIIYNKWQPQMYHPGYACEVNPGTGSYVLAYNTFGGNTVVTDSIHYVKQNITFGSNGGSLYNFHEQTKNVDLMTSTCSQFLFEPANDFVSNFSGAWNYNSATGKMVLVFEFDEIGIPSLEAYEFDVVKVNNNNIILRDNSIGYPAYFRFEK
jgi:hypothetical protein